jgi:hypothetical protein
MKTALTAIAAVVAALTPITVFAQDGVGGRAITPIPIQVSLNGVPVQFSEVAPVEIGGRVLVPLRDVIYNIKDFAVTWDASRAAVTAAYGDRLVKLKMGSHTAWVNGASVQLDTPPVTMAGRTMVPLRFLSEALGATVTWDSNARTVAINTLGTTDVTPRSGFLPNGTGNAVDNGNSSSSTTPRFYRTGTQRDAYISYLMARDYDLYLNDPEAWKRGFREYLQRQSSNPGRATTTVEGVQAQYFADLDKILQGNGKRNINTTPSPDVR